MLDFAYRSLAAAPAGSVPAGQPADPAFASLLPSGIRALFGRIAARRATAPDARTPRETPASPGDAALRARAEAAYRIVDGAADRALDAALGVMEHEIAELRGAVRAYGEALKSIQTYAADRDIREAARAALRARPQQLAAAPPVPRAAVVATREARHG